MDFVVICLLIAVLICIYWYLTRNYNYWKIQNVPCAPRPFPGFGHLLPLFMMRENFGMMLEKLYNKMDNNSMYGCFLMQTPAILIRDPELIKTVLQSHSSNFRNNYLSAHEDVDPIVSRNAFFAKDDVWRNARLLLANNFSGKRMRYMFAVTNETSKKLIEFIDRKKCNNFEVRELIARTISEVIGSSIFGVDSQSFSENDADYHSFYKFCQRYYCATPINGFRQNINFFLPNLAKFMGIYYLPKEFDTYIRDHTFNFINYIKRDPNVKSDCFIFPIEDVDKIDVDMLVSQATSIFFDGYESLITIVTYAIYRLTENPLIQDKARREVYSVMDKFNDEFTYEAVKTMTYLEKIVYETMRMNPTFIDSARVCNEQIELKGYDDLTCRLNPGDVVLMAPGSIHMDKQFWPNPDKFDPERFNADNKDNVNKYTYLAFSQGARICPGKRMGIMIVKTLLASILHRYSLHLSSKPEGPLRKDPSTFISMILGELWVEFQPLSACTIESNTTYFNHLHSESCNATKER